MTSLELFPLYDFPFLEKVGSKPFNMIKTTFMVRGYKVSMI